VAGRVVLIGAGGIGAPAALALCEAGVRRLVVVDDDCVELTNLHRQILFTDDDIGRDKGQAFRAALEGRYPDLEVALHPGRALPDTVLRVVRGAAVVIDATDNFASRFLLADAAFLEGVPIVHAAAVRWQATVLVSAAAGRPCYRCLFEDLPEGVTIDCATAGVVGPVCGVAGALAADGALAILDGDDGVHGRVTSYDGLRDRLRSFRLTQRGDCPLCSASPQIGTIDETRYVGEACDAG
jgi:adenylyltransferase/sulfurtransferase